MRRPATLVLFTLCIVLCGAASAMAAAYPLLTGTYKTLNGTIEAGRATESMPYDGGEGVPGNTLWAESWNGSALGGNWQVTCPRISGPPSLILDGVVNGTGQRIYLTAYAGGALWLSGAGAWGAGAPYYTGTLTSFTVTTTKQFVGGTLVGVVSNINFVGSFEGEAQCFAMDISNAELVGMTGNPFLPPPAGVWPALHGPSDCVLTGAHGTWWDVHDVTLSILGRCATPGEMSTWGRVKSLYR